MKVTFEYGTKLFGEVLLPERGCVMTRFWHFSHLPFYPLESLRFEEGRQGPGTPVPLHAGSVALGYLRSWGALAVVALSVWAVILNGSSSTSWSRLIAVPVVAMLLTCALVATLGVRTPPVPFPRLLMLAVLVLPMLGGSAFLWWSRASRDHARARAVAVEDERVRELVRAQDLSRREETVQRDQAAFTARVDRQVSELRAMTRVLDVQFRTACDDAGLRAAAGGKPLEVAVLQLDPNPIFDGWLTSPALRELTGAQPQPASVEWAEAHRYVVGVNAMALERSLVGVVKVYARAPDRVLCHFEVKVPLTGEVTPEVKTAFRAALARGLKKVSPLLALPDGES